MHPLIIVVDKPRDWKAYYPSDSVISVQEYLGNSQQYQSSKTHVINLCRSYKYLTNGYYCSLLAEARKHKVIPSVRTINDLSNKSLYSLDIENLNQLLDKSLKHSRDHVDTLVVKVFFGTADIPGLEGLGRQVFDLFSCPILNVTLKRRGQWLIESIKAGSINTLSKEEEDLFAAALERFNAAVWRKPKSRKRQRYDIAILVNPDEMLPPSDKQALKKFVSTGKQMGLNVELITKRDYIRLAEYDALFIRETTAINDHTYRFAKRAESEGMVVIDDPGSILRCTNKIYLADMLKGNNVATPKTLILGKDEIARDTKLAIEALGFPMIIKIPDGSFSRGIVKVTDRDSLHVHLGELFKQSALVLAQEFVYTDYDWRVGILNKKAIYACKYYMTRGHWQIYKHGTGGRVTSGGFETLPVHEVPKKVVNVAIRAANLIGDGFYGVDVKQTGSTALVIEVNDNPSIDAGVENAYLKDELYRLILNEFVRRLDHAKAS